jgi:5-methylcytosine-specific restriction enzyme A
MEKRNFGILASISWNSRNWTGPATDDDLKSSNYAWVKENHRMMEDLNFAFNTYPHEPDDTYIAYTPMFNRMPSQMESKYVEIVFFKSLDYHLNQTFIVGFYAFPRIDNCLRTANHIIYKQYMDGGMSGNVRSKPEHIVLFKNPILISETIVSSCQYLPVGKKLGQQGFNYLHSENVLRILDKATSLNPTDVKLKNIKFKFLTEFKKA